MAAAGAAGLVFTVMTTWKPAAACWPSASRRRRGRWRISRENLKDGDPRSGNGHFHERNGVENAAALRQNLEHNKVLHERVVFVTVKTAGAQWPKPAPGGRKLRQRAVPREGELRFHGGAEHPGGAGERRRAGARSSGSERHHFSFLDAKPSSRRGGLAWRRGGRSCLPSFRATRRPPRHTFEFRPTGSSSWGNSWRFSSISVRI